MVRSVISLILALDVLLCPFACGGAISIVAGAATDSCCSPVPADPADESPRPNDDGCDGSCDGCLCGGAVNGDENAALELAPDTVTHNWSLVFTVSATPSASGHRILDDDNPVFPSGVELRALLQSFLL
jgi:hypothetical protein